REWRRGDKWEQDGLVLFQVRSRTGAGAAVAVVQEIGDGMRHTQVPSAAVVSVQLGEYGGIAVTDQGLIPQHMALTGAIADGAHGRSVTKPEERRGTSGIGQANQAGQS